MDGSVEAYGEDPYGGAGYASGYAYPAPPYAYDHGRSAAADQATAVVAWDVFHADAPDVPPFAVPPPEPDASGHAVPVPAEPEGESARNDLTPPEPAAPHPARCDVLAHAAPYRFPYAAPYDAFPHPALYDGVRLPASHEPTQWY
ncbi:hypothetical protein ACFSL4_19790 [Streptomyces caeni]|uniref:Uncharacterized protein n=1 Tax=Streptomyces caeni TaxID=2307231 RepID=A0ABW4IV39_9ACTN